MTVAATRIENHRTDMHGGEAHHGDSARSVPVHGKESGMKYGPKHAVDRVLMYAILAVVGVNYVAQVPCQRNGLSASAFRHGMKARSPERRQQYRTRDVRMPYAIQLEHANV